MFFVPICASDEQRMMWERGSGLGAMDAGLGAGVNLKGMGMHERRVAEVAEE